MGRKRLSRALPPFFMEVTKLKQSKTGSLAVCLFLYIPVVWAALLIAQSLGGGLPDIVGKLTVALENPFSVHWTEYSGLSILFCTAAYILALLYRSANQGRTRDGEEHGSATWASPREVNAQFSQKENKLLTRNVRLGLDTHKHRRSLNVLVIGGSGAGKSRSYVKPNILEANTNYVVTDPKSEVLLATGGWLEQNGYDIRVLNLVNLEESDGYNPFRYIRDEKDALRLVNNLIQATTPKGNHGSDPFWEKSETALLQAVILWFSESDTLHGRWYLWNPLRPPRLHRHDGGSRGRERGGDHRQGYEPPGTGLSQSRSDHGNPSPARCPAHCHQ